MKSNGFIFFFFLRGNFCVIDGEGLGEELPSLAKEVARVEAVRAYAGESSKIS